MTYKSALIASSREALCNVAKEILEGHDNSIWLEMIVKLSKPTKRYFAYPKEAEEYAEKLGSYTIKQVDDYLKTLKEGK